MSRDTESIMSSAISVSEAGSFSDDGSTLSAEGGVNGVIAGKSGSSLFDLGDGDLRIIINGITFETHKFLVKRFAGLKDRIKNNDITLEPGEPGLEVFENAFQILYASVVEGPFEFNHSTLTSALLLATKYHYAALRLFAITKLEKAALSAVERIRLAREFGISSWEEPAYLELCERDEAISMLEAAVLGLEAVVHMAQIREKEQRRRGKEVDAAEELKDKVAEDQANAPEATDSPATPAEPGSTIPTAASPNLGEEKKAEGEISDTDVETTLKPSFVDFPTPSAEMIKSSYLHGHADRHRIELNVPSCECSIPYFADPTKLAPCQCKLPPCAVSALKQLQRQQIAHRSNISTLKTAVEQIQVMISKTKPNAEDATEISPNTRSGTLQNDVRNWLSGKKRDATKG